MSLIAVMNHYSMSLQTRNLTLLLWRPLSYSVPSATRRKVLLASVSMVLQRRRMSIVTVSDERRCQEEVHSLANFNPPLQRRIL